MGFGEFFDKYSGKSGYTAIEMSSDMIKLIGGISAGNNGDELSDALEGIDNIKIIIADRPSEAFGKDMDALAANSEYKMMTLVSEGKQELRFYLRPITGGRSEFLLLNSGPADNLVISIRGKIDVKKISGLSQIRYSVGGTDKPDKAK
jgi:hypothetical protein